MASAHTLKRIERLVWIFVYSGALLIILGLADRHFNASSDWLMLATGGVAMAVGWLLVWVRSRLTVDG